MSPSYPDLKGKIALITGAGRSAGLGAAMARRLAGEGVHIALADLGAAAGPNLPESAIGTHGEMAALADQLRAAHGVRVTCIAADMRDAAQVERMVAQSVSDLGGLDILVNNAGIGYLMKPILEMTIEEFDTVMAVNLRAVWLASRAAAAQMIKQERGGKIVNIASQAAKSGFPYASAYCASKHGLLGLTRVAAIEWGKHQINVNAICPNHVTTGLGAWQNEYFAKALGLSLEQYLEAMRSRIPLGRAGLSSDSANACAFLCSQQSEYMTGEAMNVSGGEEYH